MNRFDEVATKWDSNPTRVKLASSINEAILNKIDFNKQQKIADFGCGTGLLSLRFCELVDEIVGFDSSKKMLEELKKKCKMENISNVKTVHFDIEHDHLPKDEFDIVLSSMTMHHLKNIEKFIKDIFLSLKSGGFVAIADLDKEDGTFHTHGNDGVHHFGFEHEYVKAIFEQVGFEHVDIENVHFVKKDKNYPIFLAVAKKV